MLRSLLVLLVACGGVQVECDATAVCTEGAVTETWEVRCEERARRTECDCFLDDAKVGSCELDFCPEASAAMGIGRNESNAALAPWLDDCCGTGFGAAELDFTGDDPVVVQEGCDFREVGVGEV